jgi:hypothetical protein
MFAKKVGLFALVAGTLFSGVALAEPTGAGMHAQCVLKQHRVTKVEPLKVTQHYGRGSSERLVGARVFVQAEPGLTAEWLQLSIERHIAGMSGAGMAKCPLRAQDVRVSVTSAGAGFAVEIAGKTAEQAKEILRRAELLAQ